MEKKTQKILIYSAIGVAVVGGSVLAYYLYNKKKNKVANTNLIGATKEVELPSPNSLQNEYDTLVKSIGLEIKKDNGKIAVLSNGGTPDYIEFVPRKVGAKTDVVSISDKYKVVFNDGTDKYQFAKVIRKSDGVSIKMIKIIK